MQHVIGRSEPELVEVYEDLGGTRYARIRRNIEQDWHDVPQDSESEPEAFWKWDEVIVKTDLPYDEIVEQVDQLWYEAERNGMPETEWRADIDNAILDLMEMAVE